MDLLTYALASFVLARAVFPRTGRAGAVIAIVAGILPDISWVGVFFGPSAYLSWHKTYTHSILAALLTAFVLPAIFLTIFLVTGAIGIPIKPVDGDPGDFQEARKNARRRIADTLFTIPLSAALLHLALDSAQSDGVMLLWPFSSKRFAADWLPSLEPILLAILFAAIAIPELFRLITSEIGAKSKGPRGSRGAIIGFAVMLLYIGVRALAHSSAVAALEARTYRDESPRRVAALPLSDSSFEWLGVVETERALHEVPIDLFSKDAVDPERAQTDYKPEPSPALEAALQTSTAHRFLASTRFPKASVVSTLTGFRVTLHSYPYNIGNEAFGRRVQVLVDTDLQGKIISEYLAWDPAPR